MVLAIMIGGALGGSFVQERGRKVLPIVVVLTIVTGVLIGWGLNGELDAIEASNAIR
jgi:ABC-type transporter Mla maintaining outer membrane lipid asymmetry permease subunit MlaE